MYIMEDKYLILLVYQISFLFLESYTKSKNVSFFDLV